MCENRDQDVIVREKLADSGFDTRTDTSAESHRAAAVNQSSTCCCRLINSLCATGMVHRTEGGIRNEPDASTLPEVKGEQ